MIEEKEGRTKTRIHPGGNGQRVKKKNRRGSGKYKKEKEIKKLERETGRRVAE